MAWSFPAIGTPSSAQIGSDGVVYFVISDTGPDTLYALDPKLATGVEDKKQFIPKIFELHQNYPNPFNPMTSIRFEIPTSSQITITVHNVIGKLVDTLYNRFKPSGHYILNWNASTLPSGVYLIRMQTGRNEFVKVRKALLLK